MNKPLTDDTAKCYEHARNSVHRLGCGIEAMRVRNAARMLFDLQTWKPNRKRQKWARRLYHDLDSIRRELADKPALAQDDEMQPAVDCIGELVDMARELMDPENRKIEELHG